MKITPAHDFNDFEVGKRHEAEGARPINVLDAEAQVFLKDNLAFFEGLESDHDHARLIAAVEGQDRFVARLRIVEMMALAGLPRRIEPNAHMVPHGDRSGVVIEPWLTDQWYVDAKTLAEPALAAVRDGRTQFVPKNWEKTYYEWLENIQPWCVSRQLWWGHQIPAWYSPWGGCIVEETEEAAYAAALADGVERGALTEAEAEALARDPGASSPRPSGATRTCSTPGSPPRSGRSRRSAGRTRRRSSSASIRPTCWSPASTSSSSGSPG